MRPDQQFLVQPREGFSQMWSSDRLTLLDIALINQGGLAELIDETTGAFPELQVIGIRPIRGTSFKQLVRTSNGAVAFRDANQGATRTKPTYENRQFNCHILNPRWEADKAVADSNEDGPEPVIADAAASMLEATFQHIGRQFYYGTSNDSKGCPGLKAIYDTTIEVDATGTTDAQKSSVWGVRATRDQVQWLLGNNGSLNVTPVDLRDIEDADGNKFTGYVQELLAHLGLKVGDLRAVGRIKLLTQQTGKGLTDNFVAQLINKFPTGMGPTHLFMNKTQREQLRLSRVTDLLVSPPIPTESHGIPIVCTDSIVDGHAAELT